MATTSSSQSLALRLQMLLARARFFSVSLFVHIALVLLGGSAVIFEVQKVPPDFVGGESLVNTSEVVAPVPPDPPKLPNSPQMEALSIAPPPPAGLSAITTMAESPTRFAAGLPSMAKLDTKLTSAASISAVEKGLSAMREGMRGGKGVFGVKEKTPAALAGTFYDLKQTRRKKPTGVTPDEYHTIFRRFVSENWRDSVIDDYFRAPQPLYTTQIMIPNMSADEGPKAFGMEKEVQPSRWLVHYRGKVSPPEDGTYRFVGAGDDVMIVRFNGKTVLDRCWSQKDAEWKAEKNYDYGWTGIPNGFARGDAIRVQAGVFYDIEVLIGEQPGGLVFACLLIEKDGIEYQRDQRGNPILPIFRVAATPMAELQPGQTLPPYLPDGPVWKATSKGSDVRGSELDRMTSVR